MRTWIAFLMAGVLVAPAAAWGIRGHSVINRVAIETLPENGPLFLRAHTDYIAFRSIIPDTWRGVSEPFLKMIEDPNHGWFREQFAFLKVIPRSRYEFVLALYKERERIKEQDPAFAQLMNVRWTGTMAYAAIEEYERIKTAMRLWRQVEDPDRKRFLELDIANYAGRLGHYTGDGAQPLHATIHHDGWQGPNPKGYSTDPRIHGKMESAFVDLMELKPDDIRERIGPAKHLPDPFQSIVDHLDTAATDVERLYQLDLEGAWAKADHDEAREMVLRCTANGARLLRDLIHTAWIESGRPATRFLRGKESPISPENPKYNPETGSAPAP
ncbi:MAG: nuclease [Bryobacterales bacterium]|nr:nuclease [Bryobacterales bacterium]